MSIIVLIVTLIICIALIILLIIVMSQMVKLKNKSEEFSVEMRTEMQKFSLELNENTYKLKEDIQKSLNEARQEIIQTNKNDTRDLGDMMTSAQKASMEIQDKRLREFTEMQNKRLSELTGMHDKRLSDLSEMQGKRLNELTVMQDKRISELTEHFREFISGNERQMLAINNTMKEQLTDMQKGNEEKLEKMRETVDEKLQKTLEERISKSFTLVSERLEQVYKGLGEMQNLASGVGDLKRVLANVKTRGILGEIQLGAILSEILSKEQYDENVATKKGSTERIEFAVKLPGDGEEVVYLPIDSKFPLDTYTKLVDAYDGADKLELEAAGQSLERAIKKEAKSIHEKYIDPPNTTDFAIMFLPVEGLYSEVVRRGLVEILQREYKINIAGPTTMAALLNSLQMGFRTLAIQKRSGEVWNILGAVKNEFGKFSTVLEATQKRLDQAHQELDKLVGVRTRKIQAKLRSVESIAEEQATEIIDSEGMMSIELDSDAEEE